MRFTLKSFIFIFLAFALLFAGAVVYWGKGAKDYVSIDSDLFHRVVFVKNTDTETVSLQVVFPYGEAANPFSEGLAHYTEHLAFSSGFGATLEKDTGAFGHSNAYTSRFATGYFINSSRGKWPEDLERLLKVAQPLDLSEDFMLSERDIVMREYDFRLANAKRREAHRALTQYVYDNGALSRTVLGTPETISNFSIDQARQLHGMTHRLEHATLLVSGPITAVALETHLTKIKPPELAPPPNDLELVSLVSPVWSDRVSSGHVAASEGSEDLLLFLQLRPIDHCTDVRKCIVLTELLNLVLDSTLEGGIAGPLRYDAFIARYFGLSVSLSPRCCLEIYFEAAPDAGVSLSELEAAFRTSLRKALCNGIPEATFDRVKERVRGGLNAVLDKPEYNIQALSQQLSENVPFIGWNEKRKIVENIKFKDFEAFVHGLAQQEKTALRYLQGKG